MALLQNNYKNTITVKEHNFMTQNTIVINSAGRGSRLGLGKPKSLVKIGGRCIIEHQLMQLSAFKDVRIVVGYCAQEVIDVASKIRSDIQFVVNDVYSETNTAYSLMLGAQGADNMVLSLDGDLMVNTRDLLLFANSKSPVIGICTPSTDDPVLCEINDENNTQYAQRFSRERGDFEWSGLTTVPSSWLNNVAYNSHVYHCLEPHLPIQAHYIDCAEVDTPDDLTRAEAWFEKGDKL